MIYRIEVAQKDDYYDAEGAAVKKDIEDLGFKNKVKRVKAVHVYLMEGDLKEFEIKKICEDLLIDPITQKYSSSGCAHDEKGYRQVEIAYNAGVMDPVEESAKKATLDLGIRGVRIIKTAKKYLIKGSLSYNQISSIAQKCLFNKVIQHIVTGKTTRASEGPSYTPRPKTAPLQGADRLWPLEYSALGTPGFGSTELTIPREPSRAKSRDSPGGLHKFSLKNVDIIKAGDNRLKKISKDGQLFLNVEEMRAIKKYFKSLGRNPTDCELETLAQTWSEHCKHKTFRGVIEYVDKSQISNYKLQIPKKIIINNLLKSTVMRVTEELKKPWCVSVFKDNSGIIRFDEKNNVCFKVETHNHPSALEPYGGAGTGIGGVIRDPLGTGLGAKPIINTDVFCFGPPDYPYSKLPKGTLHPKRVMKGVVAGVRDYGNRMGIPTSNGAVLFDEKFVGNPLVFCGNVGIMPKNKSFKKVRRGDLIVVVGGRTGRDGIHGATFSSGELTHESEEISGSAVQIGNPIQEKKMVDTILQARDKDLYTAITDCGAGGLSSAVGEMGEELGAEVHLDKVPLKYKGLRYDEIWISEAQERMVLAADPRKIEALKAVFERENVEATVIGKFTGNKRLRLFYEGNLVCDMAMKFIHDGVPNLKRKAVWKREIFKEPRLNLKTDLTKDLLGLLSNLNIASKEWIIRQYDHEVQGGSIIKPLQGPNSGPGDACITRPILDSKKGIILSCGINPDYGKIDPYWMAASAIDEALRQIVSVGGDINKCAILDNFCWGNTNKPDRLGGLVRAAWGCYDIAKAYGVPFISGKDSLNNEYSTGKKTISIPPTLLISAIAVMDDISNAITMDLKRCGNTIYIVGITYNEMGGSQYYKMKGYTGNDIPRVDPACGRRVMNTLSAAIKKGYVASCHDCSEGGIAVAMAEMAFAGGLGIRAHIGKHAMPAGQQALADHIQLFSESNTRFVVEVKDEKKFAGAMKGVPIWKLGNVTGDKAFKIIDADGKLITTTDIDKLKSAWQSPFESL